MPFLLGIVLDGHRDVHPVEDRGDAQLFRRLQESGRTESRPLRCSDARATAARCCSRWACAVAENGRSTSIPSSSSATGRASCRIAAQHDAVGVTIAALAAPDRHPDLRRALRPHRPTSGVSPAGRCSGCLRVPVLLAAADAVADRGRPGDSARRGVRAQGNVRSAGGLFLRALRRQRALQRRVARVSARIGGVRRTRAVHRHGAPGRVRTPAVAAYMVALAAITVVATWLAPETHQSSLAH